MLKPIASPLNLVLVSPQIPPNTGNVARLCAVTGSRLILIEPLGFSIDDRSLKRAGLDYWDKVFLKLYSSYQEYVAAHVSSRRVYFSSKANQSYFDFRFAEGDHLVFGSETSGLPDALLEAEKERAVTIPMLPQSRCLNLSTSVGVATYEALRQIQMTLK